MPNQLPLLLWYCKGYLLLHLQRAEFKVMIDSLHGGGVWSELQLLEKTAVHSPYEDVYAVVTTSSWVCREPETVAPRASVRCQKLLITPVRGEAVLKPGQLKPLREYAGPWIIEILSLVCPWKAGSSRDHPLGAHLFDSLNLQSGEGLPLVALIFLTKHPVRALGTGFTIRVKGTIRALGKRLRLCFGSRSD